MLMHASFTLVTEIVAIHILNHHHNIFESLEKRTYPPEAYVDAMKEFDPNNTCILDSMCWTRYEKKKKQQYDNNIQQSPRSSSSSLLVKIDPIKPTADTYIRDGKYSTLNYGSDDILAVKTASSDYIRISLLQFPTNYETNAKHFLQKGLKAKLRLYVTFVDKLENSRTISIAKMKDDFVLVEDTTTWGTYSFDISNKSSLTITHDEVNTWVEIDITEWLVDMSTSKQITFALFIDGKNSQPSSNNLVEFASRENTLHSPRLVFEDMYTSPVPTPSPSGLCKMTWDESNLSDEDVQERIEYIEDGCTTDDETFRQMLLVAHDQCLAELIAESMAISIIKQPNGRALYTHVSVDW